MIFVKNNIIYRVYIEFSEKENLLSVFNLGMEVPTDRCLYKYNTYLQRDT